MSNGTPSPGKDEIFDRTARLVMTSVNDADMEAFLLSYPMVLTPKNDLALLWAEEYRKACSWRLDGDTRKKHHAESLCAYGPRTTPTISHRRRARPCWTCSPRRPAAMRPCSTSSSSSFSSARPTRRRPVRPRSPPPPPAAAIRLSMATPAAGSVPGAAAGCGCFAVGA
ncbi:uncharacterized protein ACA1_393550 [Acanthamoeba castellanii str. Neff]|uniref:Uncharacterized protein n=1 Tax=Acanthamoeba castellanii (strain ATCC 30010 / Neff) TaxID=1257118 RepID=L8GZK8_ACACF|nr:uncharacterized protein ACA1_393550 [Acanthamoeba castellanii str. Neff]ELR18669.1 hypothetical protein ACA1_393550 [Acanthamoeba castellanii str. Neff]